MSDNRPTRADYKRLTVRMIRLQDEVRNIEDRLQVVMRHLSHRRQRTDSAEEE